ncbi:nitroreductase, partial [Xanthomonas oryzae pv. oryzae]
MASSSAKSARLAWRHGPRPVPAMMRQAFGRGRLYFNAL